MNAIKRLSEREEDKLRQLGERRKELTAKADQLRSQLTTLQQLSKEYQGAHHSNPLLWQNQQQLASQLQPMTKSVERQLALTVLEQQRQEKFWQAQLGRWQGLKWLAQQRLQEQRMIQERQEQKAADDLASRPRLS